MGGSTFVYLFVLFSLILSPSLFVNVTASGDQVLVVVGNSGSLTSRETYFISLVTSIGLTPTYIDDGSISEASVTGYDLVFISESVSSTNVGGLWKTKTIPLVSSELYIGDEQAVSLTDGNVNIDVDVVTLPSTSHVLFYNGGTCCLSLGLGLHFRVSLVHFLSLPSPLPSLSLLHTTFIHTNTNPSLNYPMSIKTY